jgi:hypothetical protein
MAIIRRPALKAGWRLQGALMVLDDSVPAEAIHSALVAAGVYVGVGAWRPEFGRFLVPAFTRLSDATSKRPAEAKKSRKR